MTKSKILLYFCLALIGGIFVSSFTRLPQLISLGFLILGIIFVSVFWKYKKIVVLGFCILFLVLGIWRHQQFKLRAKNNDFIEHINQEAPVTLMGAIGRQPDTREKTTRLVVQPENFDGKILITTWKYPEYQYGDRIKITGKLEEPMIFEDFNYKEYLSKDGIYAQIYFPKIELINRGLGNPVMRYIFSLKSQLKESLNKIMSFPQSGLLAGLMFGDEEDIPKIWKEKFNLTGTRHITAVSGMNITIISFLALNFLLALGFWRHQAFYLSVIFIICYVLMIAAPASGIRAGIMGIIFLAAQHFGRTSNGFRILIFAAAIMLFLNPQLLKADVGFQLSFLATLGLILLQPIFFDLFKKAPRGFELRYTLSATLAAQFFVLPILVYNFGQVPLVGPLANILIVPLLAPVTILGFLFSLLGMISFTLGQILSFPVWLILTYILKIIDFSSKIPYATLFLKNVSFVWVLISYLFLAPLVWRLKERRKLKFLQY